LILETGDGEVGDRNQELLAYFDLTKPTSKPVSLVDVFEAEYIFLGNEGPIFYVQTTLEAPKKRIMAIDTRSPWRSGWKTIVPEGKDAIDGASIAGHQLIVATVRDAHTAMTAYDLTGKKLHEIPLPGIGSAVGFGGEPGTTTVFYLFTSFTVPWSIYQYDLASGLSTPWKTSTVPFDASQFETAQFFYSSKDGTKVPLFLVSKKGIGA
jgi:prolyl oligopeptidase